MATLEVRLARHFQKCGLRKTLAAFRKECAVEDFDGTSTGDLEELYSRYSSDRQQNGNVKANGTKKKKSKKNELANGANEGAKATKKRKLGEENGEEVKEEGTAKKKKEKKKGKKENVDEPQASPVVAAEAACEDQKTEKVAPNVEQVQVLKRCSTKEEGAGNKGTKGKKKRKNESTDAKQTTEQKEDEEKKDDPTEENAVDVNEKKGKKEEKKSANTLAEPIKVDEQEAAKEETEKSDDLPSIVEPTKVDDKQETTKEKKRKKKSKKEESAPDEPVQALNSDLPVEPAQENETKDQGAAKVKKGKKKTKKEESTPEEAVQALNSDLPVEPVQENETKDQGAAEGKKGKKKGKKEKVAVSQDVLVDAMQPLNGDNAAEEQENTKQARGTKRKNEDVDEPGAATPDVPKKKKAKTDHKADEQRPANGDAAEAGENEQNWGKNYFQRVKAEKVEFLDERLKDNSYWAKDGADAGWGAKAEEVLGNVRGRNFRHEKTKKKRGSYRGGAIDIKSHSIKFDDGSE